MSEENAIVNDGDGAKLVPVEAKECTLTPAPEAKKKRPYNRKPKTGLTPVEVRTSTAEPSAVTESVPVEDVVAEREWYCSTCRENISDKNVMKIGAGTDRWAVFCPQCQRSFGFIDQAVLDKVAELIKNNPTGK
jgi:hypothetical protein